MVRKLKAKYKWCFSSLKCNKIGASDAIKNKTAKNRKNNIFRRKQRTNKVLPNIFRGFEVGRKIPLMLWRPKDSMKVKCYVFSSYKQRNNVFLVYLVGKLQQDGYGWCIFKLKCQKMVERIYLETSKWQTRHRWCF